LYCKSWLHTKVIVYLETGLMKIKLTQTVGRKKGGKGKKLHY